MRLAILSCELESIKPGIPMIPSTGFSDEADEQHARSPDIKEVLIINPLQREAWPKDSEKRRMRQRLDIENIWSVSELFRNTNRFDYYRNYRSPLHFGSDIAVASELETFQWHVPLGS